MWLFCRALWRDHSLSLYSWVADLYGVTKEMPNTYIWRSSFVPNILHTTPLNLESWYNFWTLSSSVKDSPWFMDWYYLWIKPPSIIHSIHTWPIASRTRMVGLALKGVRLAPNGTNPGLFQIRFQCIWRPAPNALKSDRKKPRICPIWGQFDQTYHPWIIL